MKQSWKLDNKEYIAMADSIHIQHKEETLGEEWLDSHPTNTILYTNYEKEYVRVVIKDRNN